jgi:uncharacterized protein with PQ loop repeat
LKNQSKISYVALAVSIIALVMQFLRMRKERERVKYAVAAIVLISAAMICWKFSKIVWEEIKKDPVANLIIPAVTALIISLLLELLRK